MANNEDKKPNGSVNYVDPNPAGSENIPIENLSISVDLYIIERKRSIIGVVEDDVDEIKIATLVDGKAPFFKGKDVNSDGSFSFTTDYTDIGSDDNKGEELLGIKSINVEYNSAYMPLITIQFTDVRGRMHEMGNDSPYNAFFSMPYPIFKLVIKGYYGKPVEYLIHLTNYNSTLASSTGNYEIKCDFIGYTYAYLSDMLLGYLKAVPYTTQGKALVAKKRLEDPSFVTFDELYEYAKILNQSVNKIKAEDPDLKALKLGKDTLAKLESILERLNKLYKITDNNNFKTLSVTGDLIFGHYDSSKVNPFINGMAEIRKELEDLKDDTVLDIDENKFRVSKNRHDNVERSHFLDDDNKPLTTYGGSDEFFKDDKVFKKMVSGFQNTSVTGKIFVFDTKPTIDRLVKHIKEFSKVVEKSSAKMQSSFTDKIGSQKMVGENGEVKVFNFNIRNYTKVLCDHVDILMESIRMVSNEAESNSSRNDELRKVSNDTQLDIIDIEDHDKIFAFPEYVKKMGVDGVFEDAWIGNDYYDINEVVFVKELFGGLVSSKEVEENYLNFLEAEITAWYATNPFDTPKYMGSGSPYDSVSNSDWESGDILKLITYRAFAYLAISTKEPTPEEVDVMARLEANNLYHTITNSEIRNVIAGNNGDYLIKTIRDQIGGEASGPQTQAEINSTVTVKKIDLIVSTPNGDKYVGKYLQDSLDVGDTGTKYFLPLVPKKDTNNIPLSSSQQEEPTFSGGDVIFSSYTGNSDVDKVDDGGVYLDILTPGEYEIQYENNNGEGNRIIEGKVDNGKILNEEEIANGKTYSNLAYNGRWNVNEYLYYNSSSYGERVNFYTYFYEKEKGTDSTMFKGGDTLKYIIGVDGEEESLPNINFFGPNQTDFERGTNAIPYSLFGSSLYYNQTSDKAKALLFLHSLPFTGLINKSEPKSGNTLFGDKIINIFSNKAGFVEVPYTWVLFIGALLERHDNGEFIKFKGTYTFLPYDDEEYLSFPTTSEYLKTNLYHDGSQNFEGSKDGTYRPIDSIILNLPVSVKLKFKEAFNNWVDNGDYRKIATKLEIFNPGLDSKINDYYIAKVSTKLNSNGESIFESSIEGLKNEVLNVNALNNYTSCEAIRLDVRYLSTVVTQSMSLSEARTVFDNKFKTSSNGTPYNFTLTLKDGSDAVNSVMSLLRTTRIIANGTWRIWGNNTTPIVIKTGILDRYLMSFFDEFAKLDADPENTNQGNAIFGKASSSDIYLTIYKNIKSIKDKWINNYSDTKGLPFNNLIDTFKFIDRGYNDVGEEFRLNPLHISSLLSTKYNDSFHSHINKILTKNNFDFIAMPNFVDYSTEAKLSEVFETYSYTSKQPEISPSFVCMYIGERSKVLDTNKNAPNDSFNLDNPNEIPGDFKNVPGFLVKYGDNNQSIFKDIHLDQSEFSETNESLAVTDEIANSYNSINSVGQNLFNVYTNRAYTSKIEMMGNAMIQPFMYYQLQNVPMFRGAYIIIKVSHSITPNDMSTTITGNRVRRFKTKMLDEATIFNNMIGNFTDINVGGINLSALQNIASYETRNVEAAQAATEMLNENSDYDNETSLSSSFKLGQLISSKDTFVKTGKDVPVEKVNELKKLCANLEVIKEYFIDSVITFNSGYRSKEYNDWMIVQHKEGNPSYPNEPAENSEHIFGRAADIVVKQDGRQIPPIIVAKAISDLIKEKKISSGGIGIYNTFTHYDNGDKNGRWPKDIWPI